MFPFFIVSSVTHRLLEVDVQNLGTGADILKPESRDCDEDVSVPVFFFLNAKSKVVQSFIFFYVLSCYCYYFYILYRWKPDIFLRHNHCLPLIHARRKR